MTNTKHQQGLEAARKRVIGWTGDSGDRKLADEVIRVYLSVTEPKPEDDRSHGILQGYTRDNMPSAQKPTISEEELVEKIGLAIAKASGINDWFKAADEYRDEANAALQTIRQYDNQKN